MNRGELIKVFAERFNLDDNEAADIVNAFFDRIRQALVEGDRVEVRGFGSFSVKDYQPYTGHNPKTGAVVTVRPKRLPVFKAGRKLKALLNDQK